MKYYRFIFILGIWMLLLPFFSIPTLLVDIFTIIPALFLIAMGIMMSHDAHEKDNTGLSYEERDPQSSTETSDEDDSLDEDCIDQDGGEFYEDADDEENILDTDADDDYSGSRLDDQEYDDNELEEDDISREI